MRDYSAVHNNKNWLQAIMPGESPNTVKIVVRTLDGGTITHRMSEEPLLDRMKRADAIRAKRKTKAE